MIIVQLKGGTGNQMFQYAAGRVLSIRTVSPLFLDLNFLNKGKLQDGVDYRDYGLSPFNIHGEVISEKKRDEFYRKALRNHRLKISGINRLFFNYRLPVRKIYSEKKRSFNPEFEKLSRNTYLNGYWPSPIYFSGYENQIRNDFKFKHQPDPVNRNMISTIKDKHESVAIHIRTGDFSKLDELGITEMSYYVKAIRFYLEELENPVFFLFGNEPKEALKKLMDVFAEIKLIPVTHNTDKDKHIEDMRLISMCGHQIIGNSTFGWWGAWLNNNSNKLISAPKKIFNDPKLNSEIQDMIPAGWLRF